LAQKRAFWAILVAIRPSVRPVGVGETKKTKITNKLIVVNYYLPSSRMSS